MHWTHAINFAAALLAIVNPLGNLPVFVSVTADERAGVRRLLALLVSGTVLGLLLVFLFAGEPLLHFFGISIAAFRIAGGILLLLIGIGMVRGGQSQAVTAAAAGNDTSDLREAENRFRNILVPLGVPLLVGPGSISTVILYAHQAHSGGAMLVLALVIIAVSVVLLACLLAGAWLQRWMGATGLDIATRLLGLILAAIAVEFILAGLAESTLHLINPAVVGGG